MPTFSPNNDDNSTSGRPRRFLRKAQIDMLEEALASVGDFGEVHLVVEKGRLRFLITHKSFDTLKWHSGCTRLDDPET